MATKYTQQVGRFSRTFKYPHSPRPEPTPEEVEAAQGAGMIYCDEARPLTPEEWEKLYANVQELRRRAAIAPWQPIETAPKDGSWVLLWVENNRQAIVAYWSGKPLWDGNFWVAQGEVCSWDLENNFYHPTHWKPLPDPPKEQP
jgi:hypothetical protein